MRFLQIAALVACLVNLALALFVIWQDHRSKLHRAYLAWGLGVAIWNLAVFFLCKKVQPEVASVFWAKLLQFSRATGWFSVLVETSENPQRPTAA